MKSNTTASACIPGSIAVISGCWPGTGLDWTGKYPAIATALRTVPAQQAYLDGELCGVQPDGIASFALIQNAADRRDAPTSSFSSSTCSTSRGWIWCRYRWRTARPV
jgi:hypothetical protein